MMDQLILRETLNVEVTDCGNLDELLGKAGISKTALRPAGIVDFGGTPFDVVSESEYIPEKTKVIVKKIENNKLVVKIADKSN
jgi:membrane-bound serine protease (ClpP class)